MPQKLAATSMLDLVEISMNPCQFHGLWKSKAFPCISKNNPLTQGTFKQ